MSKVITFSRTFPTYHPKAGQSTGFVEKVCESLIRQGIMDSDDAPIHLYSKDWMELAEMDKDTSKHHTIRAGHRWKVGDKFSPRIWSGKPYASKMIQFAPDIEIKKIWDFEITHDGLFNINKELYAYSSSHDPLEALAKNDGLSQGDLLSWFPTEFKGQIICWNENIEY